MFSEIRQQFQIDRRAHNGAEYFCKFYVTAHSKPLFGEYRVTKIGYKYLHFLSNTTGIEYKTRLHNVQQIFGGTDFIGYEPK